MQSSAPEQTSSKSNKTELIEVNSHMSEERVTQNLLNALKNSGYEIEDKGHSVTNLIEREMVEAMSFGKWTK